MSLDEIFVHIDANARTFEGEHRSCAIDCERCAAKLIPEEIFARHIRLEITPVFNGAKEVNRCGHIDARGRGMRIDRQLPGGRHRGNA